MITSTLPRRTFFSRRDPTPGRGEQAIAANFDYVFITTSLNKEFNVKRLALYLEAAALSRGTPVVVLTKADLSPDYAAQVNAVGQLAPDVAVHAVSAHTGYGLDDVRAYLSPCKTIVCMGSSGVGKSSLINVLCGAEVMDVNGIREFDDKGRHTTTHRQLILMPSGAMLIDTPGMRSISAWIEEKEEK